MLDVGFDKNELNGEKTPMQEKEDLMTYFEDMIADFEMDLKVKQHHLFYVKRHKVHNIIRTKFLYNDG